MDLWIGLAFGGFMGYLVGHMRGMEAGAGAVETRLASERAQRRMRRVPHDFSGTIIDYVGGGHEAIGPCDRCEKSAGDRIHIGGDNG